MTILTRRDFVSGIAATAVAAVPQRAGAQGGPIPIIDTHIHLFDPNRPQGAPYSGPRAAGAAPIAAYPDRYRKLAMPLGSVGAIKVEASPWIEDNLWVLEVAQRDTIVVGVIGNLEPDKPEFKEYFDRYRKHPLFRGIRYGNLWGRDIAKQADNPAFIDGLKLLADADLVLDTANPNMSLLASMLKLSDKVPTLRIVLDHLQLPRQAGPARHHVRRGPHPVRKRLAQQRRGRADRSGFQNRERVLRIETAHGRREVLLEELHRRVQVDETRSGTAFALRPRRHVTTKTRTTRTTGTTKARRHEGTKAECV
jgi:L-fuconolactonase